MSMFINNNRSNDALVKGYSRDKATNWMVMGIIQLEYAQMSWNWYTRVPNPSNICHKPSRLDLTDTDQKFVQLNIIQPVSFKNGAATFSKEKRCVHQTCSFTHRDVAGMSRHSTC